MTIDNWPLTIDNFVSLFYFALSFLFGIAAGRPLIATGLLGCAASPYCWLAPFSFLPLAALLRWRLRRNIPIPPMQWPISAGFEPPIHTPPWPLLFCLVLGFTAGILRYAAAPFDRCWTPADLAYYNLPVSQRDNRSAPSSVVIGWINNYPTPGEGFQTLVVAAETVEIGEVRHPVYGQVRAIVESGEHYRYGQPVQVTGRMFDPASNQGVALDDALARRDIFSVASYPEMELLPGPAQGNPLLRMIYAVRDRGVAAINRALPEPYAALANGMIFGVESGIPKLLFQQFIDTGAAHVIVISGANVALITGVLMGLAVRLLGARRALWPTLAGIATYAVLVGGDAAVIRASIMGGLVVVAATLNRRSMALVSLSVACGAMIMANPLALWDIGLQLSSMATAGLAILQPVYGRVAGRFLQRMGLAPTHTLLMPGGARRWITPFPFTIVRSLFEDGLAVTLSAVVMTLPLMLFYFNNLSVATLITNFLIVPVQPLILFGGSAGALLGILGLEVPARLPFWLAWTGLAWTVGVVEWAAQLPGATHMLPGYSLPLLALTYAAIFALRWRSWLQQVLAHLPARIRTVHWSSLFISPVAGGALAVGVILIWSVALTQPDGRLHIWFLDVGQGDGILIQTPRGRQVLIDGGAKPQLLFAQLGEVMPFWDRTLDLAVLTHPDDDHMAAQVELPARFAINTAIETNASRRDPRAEPWRIAMTHRHVNLAVQHAGGWIDLGDGVALWVLWPPAGESTTEEAGNETSLVLKLVYGNFSVLLTGDAEQLSEAVWVQTQLPLQSTVLKVGHHGSAKSTTAALVAAVDPAIAVIQVGTANRYRHPAAEVLNRLAGRTILRNDYAGRIHLWSDGTRVWIDRETETTE